jgi:hypothetical protein
VSATKAMKSLSSPAPCRAEGGEDDVVKVEQTMASDVRRALRESLLFYVSFAVFNQ